MGNLLQVSATNRKFTKLDSTRRVYSISLPAGYTCPFAKDCHARAVLQDDGTRKIVDGPDTVFRCFSASQEAQYKATYTARHRNLALLKASEAPARLILDSLESKMPKRMHGPDGTGLVRPHISGDFYSLRYLNAWASVARMRPLWTVYAYTKALPLVARMEDKPTNFRLIASMGGTHDRLAETLGMRTARVVYSEEDAHRLGLEIDKDDSLAAYGRDSFALLIHATQPKGSTAAAAVSKLRANKR